MLSIKIKKISGIKLLSLILCALVFQNTSCLAQEKLSTFPLSSVRLLESPFKKAQDTDLHYILELKPDRLLAPFLREAGITPKAENYGNWEGTGLDGHIGGHYISALSEMYAATGNKEIKNRLEYMIAWIDTCQQKNGNGYVAGIPGGKAMWEEVAKGNIHAETFALNGKWVPWYNIHKLYAGLIDAYQLAGNEKAKNILIKLSDWCVNLVSNLSDDQIQTMLSAEHGGMNEVFADVAAITGDKKYLKLSERFSHKKILGPLKQHKDELTGIHANTQIPKVIGFARIAEVSGDQSYEDAAKFFWNTVVQNRTISIGGNSVREHFNPINDFSSMLESREGPETCNSYNMLKLSKHLFLEGPEAKYMDYYERTTYNHILSSQHPDGGFVYFTPIRPRHYRVYSQPQQGFWCCVGSGLENHGKYGELIYAHSGNDLYVNLFIPSTLEWKEKNLSLKQETKFPYEEKSNITLALKKPSKFAVKFRYPSWVEESKLKLLVNQKEVEVRKDASNYFSVERNWKTGDVITVVLPMTTKAERLPDHSDWISFVHGPIVLAAPTEKTDLVNLKADDSRMGHIASGPIYPLEDAPLIVSNAQDVASLVKPVNSNLTFAPTDLIYQEKFKNLQLVPFYTIHDSRYMLYWPITTKENLPNIQKAIKEREELKMKLDAVTIDVVTAGEQQPESDHNYKGEKSNSGMWQDRHYRLSNDWFSYDLKNTAGAAKKLRITYWGADRDRNFDILINNVLLKTIMLTGADGNKFVDKEFDLPAEIKNKPQTLEVKFKAHSNSTTAGIYEVRLMKE
jgi:DUF1680 family protein